MREKTSDCRGCQDCTHCGLDEEYDALFCDECGNKFDELYEIDGEELCEKCSLKSLQKVVI